MVGGGFLWAGIEMRHQMQRLHRMVFVRACIGNNQVIPASLAMYIFLIYPIMYHVSKGSTRMLEILLFLSLELEGYHTTKKKKNDKNENEYGLSKTRTPRKDG